MVTLSVAQARALESASIDIMALSPGHGVGSPVDIQDTEADIATLTPQEITGLPPVGITGIETDSGPLDLTVAQAQAVQGASLTVYADAIVDTAANIETALAEFTSDWQNGQPNLFDRLAVSTVQATDGSIVLSVPEIEALSQAFEDFQIGVPTGDTVMVVDTAQNIESFLASQSQYDTSTLLEYSVQGFAATDQSITLTVVEALGLESGGLPVSVPAGDVVGIADMAANIESMTSAQLAGLPTIGVSLITITSSISGGGTLPIGAGETLEAQGAVGAGEIMQFDTSTSAGSAVLLLDDPIDFAGTIGAFVPGDIIRLNPADATLDSITLDPTGHIITLIGTIGGDPGPIGTIDVAPTVLDSQLSVEDNSVEFDEVACFLAGTLISTEQGEVPVERLAIGDKVRTLGGALCPIVWIGMGRVLATRGRRTAATPVIVQKGAIADNVPHHDLRITKGHALFVDDVLIPVEFLVNHCSIRWDYRAREVVFYHIELEEHDVLLANGAPAENYRDDGNRWLFQNANSTWDFPLKAPCAPLLTGGCAVEAAWRRLLGRAGGPRNLPLTCDPDLHLLVNGRRLDAVQRVGDAYIFELPDQSDTVRIVSRAAVPQELGLARDPRSLGVALRRVVVRRGTKFRVIEAHDDALAEGFHAFEADNGFRWTDGDALVPAELLSGFATSVEIVLTIACTAHYLDEGIRHLAA